MKRLLPLALLTLGLAAGNLRADTLVVLPGSSIQAKIDEAKDGDIIAIFGGSYAENLTVTKAIRFAEVQNQDVTFLGDITIDGVENPPPLQGLTFGGDKNFLIQNTTGTINVRDCEFRDGNSLNLQDTTGDIIIRDCEFTGGGNLHLDPLSGTILMEGGTYNAEVHIGSLADKATLNNVTITGHRLQIGNWPEGRDADEVDDLVVEVRNCQLYYLGHERGSLYVADSSIHRHDRHDNAIEGKWVEAKKLVLFRVNVYGRTYTFADKAWMGYSKFRGWVRMEGRHDEGFTEVNTYVFIGNEINHENSTEESAIYIDGLTSSALVANNKIWNQRGAHDDRPYSDNCISVWNPRWPIIIQNNFLHHNYEHADPWSIRIKGDDRGEDWHKVKVINNVIFNDHGRAINANFGVQFEGNVIFKDNDRNWSHASGGDIVVDTAKNTLRSRDQNPGFVAWSGNHDYEAPRDADVYTLTEGSVLRDAGSENPLYNDRDGTRNDAGPSGGAWYDPGAWTTDKPVVISFDISPEAVLEGVDTEVIISGGTAVSAP